MFRVECLFLGVHSESMPLPRIAEDCCFSIFNFGESSGTHIYIYIYNMSLFYYCPNPSLWYHPGRMFVDTARNLGRRHAKTMKWAEDVFRLCSGFHGFSMFFVDAVVWFSSTPGVHDFCSQEIM